jgi:hypothetical protein
MGTAGPAGPAGPKGDPGAAGAFRVVAPNAASASCEAAEVMISAYCTGSFTSYPLKPAGNGAACGDAGATDVKVTIVCARR